MTQSTNEIGALEAIADSDPVPVYLIEWVMKSYGFVLPTGLHDGREFARRISEAYDISEPHNARAYHIARQLPGRFEVSHFQVKYTE